jgi:hypothetical protein
MVDKNKAVVCRLLATSAIMLSEKKKRKRKMWIKKWHLKRNISFDGHLLNELLETDAEACLEKMPSWCRQVNWENVGFPEWTAQFSVWKAAREDSSEACVIACQNCAFYSVFPSGMTSHSKMAQFNQEYIGRLTFRVNPNLILWPHRISPNFSMAAHRACSE